MIIKSLADTVEGIYPNFQRKIKIQQTLKKAVSPTKSFCQKGKSHMKEIETQTKSAS